MTYKEALYVLEHREMYDDKTYHYALDIVEDYKRQHQFDIEEDDR